MQVEFGGEGSSCLLSLSALALPAVWMVLPSPAPMSLGSVCLSFCCFFILKRLAQSPPPSPALRLIYLSLRTRLLCFQPLLLPYS